MIRHTQLLVFCAFLFLCWNGAALLQGADQAVSDAAKIQEGMALESSNDYNQEFPGIGRHFLNIV